MLAAAYYHSMAVVKSIFPTLNVSLTDPAWSPPAFSFSFAPQSGRVYGLERKKSLAEADWVRLSLFAGSGGILRLADPDAAGPQGFYRLRQW